MPDSDPTSGQKKLTAPVEPQRRQKLDVYNEYKTKYATGLNRLYSSPLYLNASPERKKKLDAAVYNRMNRFSMKYSSEPLNKENWDFMAPQGKAKWMNDMRPDPRNFYTQKGLEQLKERYGKGLRPTEPGSAERGTLAKSWWDLWGDFGTEANKKFFRDLPIDAIHLTRDAINFATEKYHNFYVEDPKSNVTHFIRMGDRIVDTLNEKTNEYLNNFEKYEVKIGRHYEDLDTQTESRLKDRQIALALKHGYGFIPELILLGETAPAERLLGVKAFEAGKTVGILARVGEYTEAMSKLPGGKTLVSAASNFIDMSTLAIVGGKRKPIDIAKEGLVGVALGTVPGVVARGTKAAIPAAGKMLAENFPEIASRLADTYAALTGFFGRDFVTQTMADTMASEAGKGAEKVSAEETVAREVGRKRIVEIEGKDEIVKKIKELHKETLHSLAEQYYGTTYDNLSPDQQTKVQNEIARIFAGAMKSSIVGDRLSAEKVIKDSINNTNGDQKLQSQVDRLNQITKKVTGKISNDGAYDNIATKTKAGQGRIVDPETKVGNIANAKTPEEVATASTKENPMKLPEEIGPSRATIDWDNRTMRGTTLKVDKPFIDQQFARIDRFKEYIEDPDVREDFEYWKAMNYKRPYGDNLFTRKFISYYEAKHPDLEERFGRQRGLAEHTFQLYVTDHMGKKENVYRTGRYMIDELRDRYDAHPTKWQDELRDEYDTEMNRRSKVAALSGMPQISTAPAGSSGTVPDVNDIAPRLIRSLPEYLTPEQRAKKLQRQESIARLARIKFDTAVAMNKKSPSPVNRRRSDEAFKELHGEENLLALARGNKGDPIELRMDNNRYVSLWVNPEVMDAIVKDSASTARPYDKYIPYWGFSAGKNYPMIDRLREKIKNGTADPITVRAMPFVEKANSLAKETGFILIDKSRGPTAIRETYGEEAAHAEQARLGPRIWEGKEVYDPKAHLSDHAFNSLSHRMPRAIDRQLRKDGYTPARNFSDADRVIEAAAKLISQPYTEFPGLTYLQAEDFLDTYFRAVFDEHGPEAFNQSVVITELANRVRLKNVAEYKKRFQIQQYTDPSRALPPSGLSYGGAQSGGTIPTGAIGPPQIRP